MFVFWQDDDEDEKDKGETAADGAAKTKKKKKKKKKAAEEAVGQVTANENTHKCTEWRNRCDIYSCFSNVGT